MASPSYDHKPKINVTTRLPLEVEPSGEEERRERGGRMSAKMGEGEGREEKAASRSVLSVALLWGDRRTDKVQEGITGETLLRPV